MSVPNFITGQYITRAMRHSGGNDIRQYEGVRRFPVEAIEKQAEYRVEVFLGAAFRGHIKRPTLTPQPFNWNRENTEWDTYGYKSIRRELGDTPIQLAKDAVAAVGYDFGAVDIIRGTDDKYYVLEVNSAPSLGDSGVGKYVYRIRKWAELTQ